MRWPFDPEVSWGRESCLLCEVCLRSTCFALSYFCYSVPRCSWLRNPSFGLVARGRRPYLTATGEIMASLQDIGFLLKGAGPGAATRPASVVKAGEASLAAITPTVAASGQPAASGAVASKKPTAYGSQHAEGLSQLTDLALQQQHFKASQAASQPVGSSQFSQESLIEAPGPLQFQAPSQPDIQPPVLQPESQTTAAGGGNEGDGSRAQTGLPQSTHLAHLPPGFPNLPTEAPLLTMAPLMLNTHESMYANHPFIMSSTAIGLSQPDSDVPDTTGSRSKNKKPTRRGPMDEMRQLVRILVKVGRPRNAPRQERVCGGSAQRTAKRRNSWLHFGQT